jgi:predicted methyltransferase
MLTRAGFEIEAQSDILMNSADDHTLNIRDESLGRATDRMLIRARKPR